MRVLWKVAIILLFSKEYASLSAAPSTECAAKFNHIWAPTYLPAAASSFSRVVCASLVYSIQYLTLPVV